MSRESHLSAISAALLELEEIAAAVRLAESRFGPFEGALIEAVGSTPGTDPGQRSAEVAMGLRDTLADALRLAERIESYLHEYRKGI